MLYRLRLTSEHLQFDSVSLSYMLPLISIVLRGKGVGYSDVDEVDEQVTLALEFLSFHADACEYAMKNAIGRCTNSIQSHVQVYHVAKSYHC